MLCKFLLYNALEINLHHNTPGIEPIYLVKKMQGLFLNVLQHPRSCDMNFMI